MAKDQIKRYSILFSLIIVLYITYLIVKPFIPALVCGFIFAYLFYPIYKRLNKSIPYKTFNAVMIVILIILIIIVPLALIAGNIAIETFNLYNSGIINSDSINSYIGTNDFITNNYAKLVAETSAIASNFIRSIPSKLIDFLIIIYTTFTLLLYGDSIVKKIRSFLPVKDKDALLNHVGDTTFAIVYGLFVTAAIMFIISLITFKIIGVKPAFFLSILIGILALIPLLGSSVVLIPLGIIHYLRGNIFTVGGIIILGVILVLIENLVKAKIIGDKAKLHPLVVIVGIFGGIKLFGFIGFIAGPVLLSALIIIIKEYYPELENEA
ncbi:MAG: AI-2E family transporter [Nanoarchaeota archaeon]